MCVDHRPLRLISKCDGTRSASACGSNSTGNPFPPWGLYLWSSGLGRPPLLMKHNSKIG
ncbi:hypothetical protein JG687_00019543 [Phytophthora cactorum]|uniref:Uncharacterized protein n=1 Tax=Phytophthora cactorum TaxID=29920 RepID=A0A8T1TJ17_9STRA|nr:hypothetical protein JG687_00019543 [Phytophthora cactorum]